MSVLVLLLLIVGDRQCGAKAVQSVVRLLIVGGIRSGHIEFVSTNCIVSQVLGLDIDAKPLVVVIEVLVLCVWLFIDDHVLLAVLLVCGIGGHAVLEMNRKLRIVVALGDAKSSIVEKDAKSVFEVQCMQFFIVGGAVRMSHRDVAALHYQREQRRRIGHHSAAVRSLCWRTSCGGKRMRKL